MRNKIVVVSVFLHVVILGGLWAKQVWKVKMLPLPGPSAMALATMAPMAEVPKVTKIVSRGAKGALSGQGGGAAQSAVNGDDLGFDQPDVDGVVGTGIGEPGDGPGGGGCLDDLSKCSDGIRSGLGDLPPLPVSEKFLKAQFKSGDTNFVPTRMDRIDLEHRGRPRLTLKFSICIDDKGNVDKLSLTKSGGYPSYDRIAERAIRFWKYHPYRVKGVARPACGTVTIIYQQRGR